MRLLASTVTGICLSLAVVYPASGEIRIGAVLSATGPASFLGDPEVKTLEMLVEEVNANGGVNGEELVLIHYDDSGDANLARTLATRLIEDDEVEAVIGGSTTGTTMAVVPLFEENEIPFISLAGGVSIIDPVKEWVFKTPHTDRMACESIFTDLNALGLSQVGLISGQGGFGSSMRAQCIDVAPTYGVDIVADETYGPRDSDMTPQLTRIASTEGVEAVVNAGFGQGPAIVTRNYAQLGIEFPFYQSHGVASDAYIDLAGDSANGVRLPSGALLIADLLPEDDIQYDIVTTYRDAYEAQFNEPVSTFGGYAHDAFWILVQAMESAGTSDPSAVRDAIEATDGFIGVTGIFTMTPEDHMGLDLSAFRMLEIVDGDWTLVE